MASTTNYSWSTPDDTALVKDGAAAIRTLGSSVDTTVKALNPGTTAGDIDYYTSSTAKSRVAIGTSGQVLTVNGSGVPAWATSSSGGMTQIATGTLSGSSTVISSIPSTYVDLRLVIRQFDPGVGANGASFRLNGDSTANRYYKSSTYGTLGATAFGATGFQFIPDSSATTNNGLSIVNIYDYTNTTTWKIIDFSSIGNDDTTATSLQAMVGVGYYNQTPAVSSITIYYPASSAGTYFLYGVK